MDRILRSAEFAPLIERWGRQLVKRCAEQVLQSLRTATAANVADLHQIAAETTSLLQQAHGAGVIPVLNLSGILIHTNLGRATLPEVAARAMAESARHTVSLEIDMANGRRGKREQHVCGLLSALCSAEAATVVNNNAAALFLILNTLALGKEVLVSRGELIEIGGSFRLPELMERAGCVLREVGTTNRTHLRDYRAAIDRERTALVLKVHPSNFAIRGFTHSVSHTELAALADEHDLPLAVDLGSGALTDLSRLGLPREPMPGDVIAEGASLVCFSGDKLLGGPQAGLIAGQLPMINALDRNPLKRALRMDKTSLAALAEVLKLYGDPDRLNQELPLLRHLRREVDELFNVAEGIAAQLQQHFAPDIALRAARMRAEIGSGAMPDHPIPSAGLAFGGSAAHLNRLQTLLRAGSPPVIGRLQDQQLLLDLRTLDAPGVLVQCLHDVSMRLRPS